MQWKRGQETVGQTYFAGLVQYSRGTILANWGFLYVYLFVCLLGSLFVCLFVLKSEMACNSACCHIESSYSKTDKPSPTEGIFCNTSTNSYDFGTRG